MLYPSVQSVTPEFMVKLAAKRDDYDNSRRFHKSITNAGKGDSSNDTTRPLREVSNSGFIQKEDIDDRLKDEDSEN